MNKQGNQNSPLLDSFLKIALANKPKTVVPFTVTTAAKQKTIEDIFRDVLKIGKNIKRTAQLDSIPTEVGDGPPMDPAMSGNPELGEGVLGTEDELGAGSESDTEGAKQGLVDALLALCGGADAAIECITTLSGGGEDVMPEDGMDDGMDEAISDEMPAMEDDAKPFLDFNTTENSGEMSAMKKKPLLDPNINVSPNVSTGDISAIPI